MQRQLFLLEQDPVLQQFFRSRAIELAIMSAILVVVCVVLTVLMPSWQIPSIIVVMVVAIWWEYRQMLLRAREGRFGEGDRDMLYLNGYFASQGIVVPDMDLD